MSIYTTWYPGEKGYKEHLDLKYRNLEQIDAVHAQTNELKNSLRSLREEQRDSTSRQLASTQQLIETVDAGMERIQTLNTRGFLDVKGAVEDMHSDMNYHLEGIMHQLEMQTGLLRDILDTLKKPFETQIREYYDNGCKFIRQEKYDAAIDFLKESIQLRMGKYFFPSYYQLGRIYLFGKTRSQNFTNPVEAVQYLKEAADLGEGIKKEDSGFSPVLAEVYFYLSQAYYFQLDGRKTDRTVELLNQAIESSSRAIQLNPKLSQAYFHRAKYRACWMNYYPQNQTHNNRESVLVDFYRAFDLDTHYLRTLMPEDIQFYEPAFAWMKSDFESLVAELTRLNKEDSLAYLKQADLCQAKLEGLDIQNSTELLKDYNAMKYRILQARREHDTHTFWGYEKCIQKLGGLVNPEYHKQH